MFARFASLLPCLALATTAAADPSLAEQVSRAPLVLEATVRCVLPFEPAARSATVHYAVVLDDPDPLKGRVETGAIALLLPFHGQPRLKAGTRVLVVAAPEGHLAATETSESRLELADPALRPWEAADGFVAGPVNVGLSWETLRERLAGLVADRSDPLYAPPALVRGLDDPLPCGGG